MKNRDIKNLIIIYTAIILASWIIGLKQENKKEAKRFNQEKTYLIQELINTKAFTIELYKEQKEYIEVLQEERNGFKDEIERIISDQNNKAYLDKLLKDLDRNSN